MKKELTEKERSLLDYICSKYSLDFSGCKARKTKKGHLFVEDGSYVFRIEKKHLELILDSDYRTENVIDISADKSSACFKDYEEYIRKKEEDAARLRKERKAERKAEKQTAAEAGGMEGKSKNRVSSKLGCGHDRYEGSFQAGWMVL